MTLNKTKKIILSFVLLGLILSGFYFTDVPRAKGGDIALAIKEYGLDGIARWIARRMLKDYLNQMVDEINTGGRTRRGPSFATNWRNFLIDAERRGEDIFGVILANTELCPYFGGKLRTMYRAKPGKIEAQDKVGNLDPYRTRAKCTMPYGWAPQDLDNNFVQGGGWAALMRLAEPQNNAYGSILMSASELAAQRALEATTDYGEITAGRGFTGTRASCTGGQPGGICISSSCVGGPYNGKFCFDNKSCAALNNKARCTFMGEILTPSNVLGDSASNYIDQNVSWLISSDEISEVLLNMLGGILSKMRNYRSKHDDGQRVDDTNEQPRDNQATRCQQQCKGQTDGTAYRTCYEGCMKWPGGPPPPSGQFCDGTDGDGVPDSPRPECDASLGETPANCPGECGPPPGGTQCSDSVDNDVPPDGQIDYGGGPSGEPADSECTSFSDNDESSAGPPPPPPGAVAYTIDLHIGFAYVTAENGGNNFVYANRFTLGPWGTFTLWDLNGGVLTSGDTINIITVSNYFFRAVGGGGSALDTTATTAGAWEQFTIQEQGGSGDIVSGDTVSFEIGGFFMIVDRNTINFIVNANGSSADPTYGIFLMTIR